VYNDVTGLNGNVGRKFVTEINENDGVYRILILIILTSTLKMETVYVSETFVSLYKFELMVLQLRRPQSKYSPP
jgi:hypothetical protein